MRLVVPFKRNYLNRTKIWTLGSPKFRVNGAKIIVKGSRVNKVLVRFFSRTKSESLVSLIIFLVTGYPLGSISAVSRVRSLILPEGWVDECGLIFPNSGW